MSEPDIKWICYTSAQEGIDAIKRLLQKPITAETLRTLEAAEQHESCRGDRRSSLLEALIRAVTKVNKVLAAEKTTEIMARKSPGDALEMEVLPADTTSSSQLSESIATKVSEINRLHARAQGNAVKAKALAEEAAHDALLAGYQLADLKKSLPHGEWGHLFKNAAARVKEPNDNRLSFDFSTETARKYIAVAEGLITQHQLSDHQQKQLQTIATAEEIGPKDRKYLNKLTDGNTLRQLYFDLGIISGPKELADKKGGPGGARTPGEKSIEEIQAAEKKIADQDAKHIALMVESFVKSKKGTIIGKDLHTFLTDTLEHAVGVLRKIKF